MKMEQLQIQRHLHFPNCSSLVLVFPTRDLILFGDFNWVRWVQTPETPLAWHIMQILSMVLRTSNNQLHEKDSRHIQTHQILQGRQNCGARGQHFLGVQLTSEPTFKGLFGNSPLLFKILPPLFRKNVQKGIESKYSSKNRTSLTCIIHIFRFLGQKLVP